MQLHFSFLSTTMFSFLTTIRGSLLSLVVCAFALCSKSLYAAPINDSSSTAAPSSLTVSGFVDAYYALAFATPPAKTRAFTTQPLYHNEFSINFAFLSLAYSSDRVRGRFAAQVGSYVESNYAAEPQFWRNIFEANVGYRAAENLWIDAGIFASHIGFESAVSKDNWTYSRSIVADYSPYYETGVKLTWTPSSEWLLSALVLNGWQIIRETNSDKSFGTQVQWKPASNLLLNWSTYIGNDQADTAARQMRYFNNFYAQIGLSEKFSLALLADVGVQQRPNNTLPVWFGGTVLAKYSLNDRLTLAARGEYYSDPQGIIILTGTANNFQTLGVSANLDVALTANLLWRIEGRWFSSRDAIYPTENATPRPTDGFVVTSLAFSF
jgi:hypothetical protein